MPPIAIRGIVDSLTLQFPPACTTDRCDLDVWFARMRDEPLRDDLEAAISGYTRPLHITSCVHRSKPAGVVPTALTMSDSRRNRCGSSRPPICRNTRGEHLDVGGGDRFAHFLARLLELVAHEPGAAGSTRRFCSASRR